MKRQNFKGIKSKIMNICKTISWEFRAFCQKFNKKSKSNRVVSREEVEHLRHEMFQSLTDGSHYENPFTTSRSGASESSSENQRLRHDREHSNVHSGNLETEKQACQSAVRSLGASSQWRGMIDVERPKSKTLQAGVLRLGSEKLQLSQHVDGSKEEVAQLQARCNECWHHPELAPVYARKRISLKNWSRCKWHKTNLYLLPRVKEWALMTPL